jgi:bacteriorhodopsin
MSLTGILLGLINIGIVVAILLLVGYIIIWILGMVGFAIPDMIQKIYMVIVALIALYMIVALLLGAPTFRIIQGQSQVPAVHGTIAAPPSIIANSK